MLKMLRWLPVCCLFTATAAYAAMFEDDTQMAPVKSPGASFETAFSPSNDVAATIVREICSAHDSIKIAAKTFVSKPVSDALVEAHRQGRDVKILVDARSNETGYSASRFTLIMGVATHAIQSGMGLADGYILIDDKDIVLGDIAGLLDRQEEKKNFAHVLIIHNAPEIAAVYLADWKTMWRASDAMKPPPK